MDKDGPETGINEGELSLDLTSDDFQMVSWPFYWIARVNRTYANEFDAALKKVGLDVGRWRVLAMLSIEGCCSVSRLADHGALRLSTMTKTVKRLHAQDMVLTRTNARDARVTEVLLTDKGREAALTARRLAKHVYRDAFAGMKDTDIEHLNALLQQVYINLKGDFRV